MPVLAELGSWLGEGRSIVAGDFNNSVIWDKAGGRYNFADINYLLGRLGLESAYHAHTAESPGQESQP